MITQACTCTTYRALPASRQSSIFATCVLQHATIGMQPSSALRVTAADSQCNTVLCDQQTMLQVCIVERPSATFLACSRRETNLPTTHHRQSGVCRTRCPAQTGSMGHFLAIRLLLAQCYRDTPHSAVHATAMQICCSLISNQFSSNAGDLHALEPVGHAWNVPWRMGSCNSSTAHASIWCADDGSLQHAPCSADAKAHSTT